MPAQVAPNSDFEFQFSMSDEIEPKFPISLLSNQIQEIPKKKLNPVVFLFNVLWMLLCCHTCLQYIFAPLSQGEERGILAGVTLGLTVVVSFPTFCYLTTFSRFIKLAFILDTIQLTTIVASLSFVSMILLFDTKDEYWHFKVIEVGFVIEAFCYSTMVRVMLVTLDWSKWQVIVFKLHAMMNCLMFFGCGIYFISTDFSYTFHLLQSFDKKVHDFMVLFIFTMLGSMYEFYNKITELDYTGDLKYIYKIKNVDQNRNKKRKSIKKWKMESIKSIKLIERSQATIQKNGKKPTGFSQFVSIQVMN